MFELLADLAGRPECFSVSTTRTLWTDAHLATRMLRFHLDPSTPLASRPPGEIERIAAWLDDVVSLKGKRVCDLGCGPGLYAQRFHDRGANVTGVDWSRSSLSYAKEQAAASGRNIAYLRLDYTTDALPAQTDLFTLIYCDFCALAPHARRSLLLNIRNALGPRGRLALDVHAMPAFARFREETLIERRLMDGFWAAGDYVGIKRSLRYADDRVTLDRYLIVEPHRQWSVFNWLQYFSIASLSEELAAAGFRLEHAAGGLTGEELSDASELIAVVAGIT